MPALSAGFHLICISYPIIVMPNNELSEKQKKFLDETIERRMKNTGETREQAAAHIADFLLTYTQDQD